MSVTISRNFTLSVASENDRHEIYQIRHQVYADELKQYSTNDCCELKDALDIQNHYIVAKRDSTVLGFISITTPHSPSYSVDKYFFRTAIPYEFNEFLYEIRLLTIVAQERKRSLALALMYAAFRWVQSHGGKYMVAICRSDLLEMYIKAGMHPHHMQASCGSVAYDLCTATVEDLDQKVKCNLPLYIKLQNKINWKLPFAFFAPWACYHGGSFFEAIGEDLSNITNAERIINADVLDAWFPPSPRVIETLTNNLSWLLKTSPPTHAQGLINVISELRGVNAACLLHGAGSSNLIFLGLTMFLDESMSVLILDPCYGEYLHVLEKVVKCRVTRFSLNRHQKFVVDIAALLQEIEKGYDMVILVNPNSPTGMYVPKKAMEKMLRSIAQSTLVWIDETYIEYAGPDESLEQFASKTENVIVCKSMSKVYAISGVRAAYLCCSPHLIEHLKVLTPPWSISLPAQAAAITALKDRDYYRSRYSETHRLRENLQQQLLRLGIEEIIEGVANFLLFYLPANVELNRFLACCREEGLYLRDVSNMGKTLGANAVRIAVKDEATNKKMIHIIRSAMRRSGAGLVESSFFRKAGDG